MLGSPHFVQFNGVLGEILLQTIKNQAISIQVYTDLIAQSPDDFSTSLLELLLAYEDNAHYRFIDFYTENIGPLPEISLTPEPEAVEFDTYKDGLLLAFTKEAEAVSFNKEVLRTVAQSQAGHSLYEYALTTNIEQQILLTMLYSHYIHYYDNMNDSV